VNVILPGFETLGQTKNTTRRGAVLFMIAFGLSWAIIEDVFGSQLRQPYNLMQIVWMRYAVHLLVVFAVWGWRQPSRIWHTRRPIFHLGRSLLMLIMPLSFASAISLGLSPALIWLLFWISPFFVIVVAMFARLERPTPWAWIGVALGSLGVLSIEILGIPATPRVTIAPFVMALSFSVYVVMTRALRTEDVAANLFYTAFGVFVVLSLLMPRVWITPNLHDLEMVIGIGAVGFLSLLCLDRAVSHASLSDTSPALYSEVAFASLIGAATTAHRPSLHALAGIVLIAAAGALAWAQPGEKT
jgi:drug/metabolite transporter (DMT)-like permease